MHVSVLKKEATRLLNLGNGARVIDCTFGVGGYTREILSTIPNSRVLAIDLDAEITKPYVDAISTDFPSRFTFVHENYRNIAKIAKKLDFIPNGIMYDLGVNSLQLDIPDRGFTFKDLPNIELDMRMNRNSDNFTAADVCNNMNQEQLVQMLKEGGEEEFAFLIARAIIKFREQGNIFRYTSQLIPLIKKLKKSTKLNACTKTFQALRICVNDELNSLSSSLEEASMILPRGGRVSIVSFHSGEDKLTKNVNPLKWKQIEVVTPSEQEVADNIRSRSAKLRVFEAI